MKANQLYGYTIVIPGLLVQLWLTVRIYKMKSMFHVINI